MMADTSMNELCTMLIKMANFALYGMSIAHQPTCNDCGRKDCEYKPVLGDNVRINCPFWQEDE